MDTEREKMHNSNHFRVENYWFEKSEDRSNFPSPFPQPWGGTRRSESRGGQGAPGGQWHLWQQQMGFFSSLTGHTGTVLHPWSAAWVLPAPCWSGHGPFPLEISPKPQWNHFSNHATGQAAWFWADASPGAAGIKPCTARKLWGWTALAEDWKSAFSKR